MGGEAGGGAGGGSDRERGRERATLRGRRWVRTLVLAGKYHVLRSKQMRMEMPCLLGWPLLPAGGSCVCARACGLARVGTRCVHIFSQTVQVSCILLTQACRSSPDLLAGLLKYVDEYVEVPPSDPPRGDTACASEVRPCDRIIYLSMYICMYVDVDISIY